ncbi:hypothetical protein Tco_0033441 [Tanacetum coccineum]
MQTARDRQKTYADKKRKPMDFQVRDDKASIESSRDREAFNDLKRSQHSSLVPRFVGQLLSDVLEFTLWEYERNQLHGIHKSLSNSIDITISQGGNDALFHKLERKITSSGWPFVSAVLGQMALQNQPLESSTST